MARRRRRRERRERPEQRAQRPEKRETREDEKRREAFEAERVSLVKRRRFVGALAFLPLIGNLGCAFGITLRLFLDRRRFVRESAGRSS
ncbi:MAG: hypothetical protein E6I54_03290 [Chloroflexi bacterium]|nr:MAG: hypothetical protein E6I54_03290 [Chloroflexota bacterium]